MKPIFKSIKIFLYILFLPIIAVVSNLFVWTIGWWLFRIPPIRNKIEGLQKKERAEWNKIESIFDRPTIGKTIKDFAEGHSMHLEKYYHEWHAWSLHFARKIGGEAKIEIHLVDAEKEKFNITAMWTVDNWADEMRHITHAKIADHLNTDGPAELEKKLEDALAKIGQWRKDDLTDHHHISGWRRTWKSLEEFEAAKRPYQVLDI